ncbi:hypothetical protein AX17_006252 [Amanita inopinata Kibby_2008]|nr:hypothetical protein AX17_006252 [Amanita inopinata Kibby_2008]
MTVNSSSPAESEHRLAYTPSPLQAVITRTVAIIKHHAIQHRFDIERRIQEASFEIIKERQMEFDTETDPDTLYELFGDDAESFSEGPVWVYVLERRRAVEVWHTLMGPKDPEQARQEMPHSLRALYGISAQQDGVMGSPDAELAEIQIASLFVSSPPFPTTELPDEHYPSFSSLDEGYARSNGARSSSFNGYGSSTTNSSKLNAAGKPVFRARPIPPSVFNPDFVPRTTRAAALRAGYVVEKTEDGPRVPPTKEQQTQTFLNVPGHKRAETIAVASTAAPTIAPRMTRAASLRIGLVPPPAPIRRSVTEGEKPIKTFEGVPGHKRRETISVASTKAPTVPPRLNKSAALRAAQKEAAAPPSSFRGAVSPARARSASQTFVRPASSLATVHDSPTSSRPPIGRSSSVLGTRPSPARKSVNGVSARSKDDIDTPTDETDRKATSTRPRRPSSVMLPPSIPPRTNKSAALRAAKKEMENAQAAAAATKGARKPSARAMPNKNPPSSFKALS